MAKGKKKMTTHKKVRQDGRPNGKAFKKHPKGFDLDKGKLYTVSGSAWKGLSVHLSE
jgi:hypothetical protein